MNCHHVCSVPRLTLLLALCSPFLHVTRSDDRHKLVYYLSPGSSTRSPGVYQQHVAAIQNKTSKSVLRYDNSCLRGDEASDTKSAHVDLRCMSYDPISNQLVMQLASSKNGFTLYRATPHMDDSALCTNTTLETLFYAAHMPSRIGPIAWYNATLYFISTNRQQVSRQSHRVVIELRALKRNCHRFFPVTGVTSFDLGECSLLVSTISDEEFEKRPSRYTTEGFVVVHLGEGRLEFILQLRQFQYKDGRVIGLAMQMIRVSENGEVSVVHTELVDPMYAPYQIHHTGAICMHDDTVCWSAMDRIVCGRWRRGAIEDRLMVLQPGHAAQVCKAGDDIIANVTTGVAIVKHDNDDLVIIFGCLAQVGGKGGAGRIHLTPGASSARVTHIESEGEPILAGSMVMFEFDAAKVSAKNSATSFSCRLVVVYVSWLCILWLTH